MGARKNSDDPAAGVEALNWSDLRVFLHVADQETFSGAARALDLSQPTVTQRVGALEKRLGAKLFLRSATGVTLTDAGRSILQHARAMERAALTIDRLARERDESETGTVRLSVSDGLAAFWITPHLGGFYDRYPKIELSIDAGRWPAHPVRDGLDISLQYDQQVPEDFVVRHVLTMHYLSCASKDYLERHGPLTTAQAVMHARMLSHSAWRYQPETWDPKAVAWAELAPPRALNTNCSSSIITAACAGAGVTSLPTALFPMLPDLTILSEKPVASPKVFLAYHRDIGRIARVRRVIDWLKEIFDSEKYPWFASEFVHPRDFPPYKPPFRLLVD